MVLYLKTYIFDMFETNTSVKEWDWEQAAFPKRDKPAISIHWI